MKARRLLAAGALLAAMAMVFFAWLRPDTVVALNFMATFCQ